MENVETTQNESSNVPTSHKLVKTMLGAGAALIATTLVETAFDRLAKRRSSKTVEDQS